MKFFKRILTTPLFSLGLALNLFANPLPLHVFNEIQIFSEDSSQWVLELFTPMLFQYNMDGCYLSNGTDTVQFKPGISSLDVTYLLIRSDSLQSALSFNPDQAVITLYDSLGNYLDELRYGSGGNTQISAPLEGMSLCYSNDLGSGTRWYMDRSPTLGSQNDMINAEGSVAGQVTDLSGLPLAGATVHYTYGTIYDVLTDTSGSYIFQQPAVRKRIQVFMEGDDTPLVDTTVQIYPDSLLIVDFQLDYVSIVDPDVFTQTPYRFALKQNYPNPFNPETNIHFDLPRPGKVKLQVVNPDGSLVTTLADGDFQVGSHSLVWDASQEPSGLYLLQLTAGEFSQSRKMILLK